MIVDPGDERGDLRMSCDVVVVGSGAGGAAVAATVAEAGYSVVVIEEGGHYQTADYSADVPSMLGKLMRGAGLSVITGRRQTFIPFLEGRCVGGTTVVNGGMCWRTPPKVLDEWVARGLTDLAPDRLESTFAEVEEIINARYQDPGSEGGNSLVVKRGAESLGWTVRRNKRNQVHCVGSNDCVTGCPSGAKQSTLVTWLPRLFAHGGRVHTHCRVERIIRDRSGRAVGVSGRFADVPEPRRFFQVDARAVVLAGGAIQTPLLLLRNRVRAKSRQIGRNFTVHPNVKVTALFPHDIHSDRGTHQAFQVTEFADEGILLAPGAIPVALLSLGQHEWGGAALAEKMKLHKRMAFGGVLVDDSASGRVSLGPMGVGRVRYDITDVDQRKFHRAVGLMAELYFAAGASEVQTPFHTFPLLKRKDEIAGMVAAAPKVKDTEYFTAHLMGTCRMSASADTGVVDPSGQMWDVPGLFIADASVMPGTIGVNPQVTIMALARLIGRRLADALGAQRQRHRQEASLA